MNIGIIGAGHIGGTLTRRLTALGHTVFVANSRGPEALKDLAKETAEQAVPVSEAVKNGVRELVVSLPGLLFRSPKFPKSQITLVMLQRNPLVDPQSLLATIAK